MMPRYHAGLSPECPNHQFSLNQTEGHITMTSMITNNSATVALQTLRSINSSLDTTNNRVSTGKKINSAADGAAYWSIATTLTSDNGALGAVKDAISLDKASVDTSTAGIKQIASALQTIKNALTSANSSTADRASLQKDIASAITNISSAATSSVMNGANWLSVDSSATGYNASKSKPQVFETVTMVVDGARNFKTILAEDALDAAIDAAIAAAKEAK